MNATDPGWADSIQALVLAQVALTDTLADSSLTRLIQGSAVRLMSLYVLFALVAALGLAGIYFTLKRARR